MAYKIVISELALIDYDKILDYLVNKLDNRKAATDLADEIDSQLVLLSKHPNMYPLSDNTYLYNKGYRKCVIHNYTMLYRVIESKNELFILRFFYGRQDYSRYL